MSKEEQILTALAASGRYRLLHLLGRGAGTLVWAAQTLPEGCEVALKILPDVSPGSARFVSLRREIALSSRLDHPHILRVRHFAAAEHVPECIEMDLAPGGSLGDVAASRGGYLDWPTLKPIMLQLCEALEHAHLAGIIHRDLKPSNLLLAADGSLRLADFGCGCLLDASGSETTDANASGYHGTLPYMSPQQLNGHPPHPGDDLYAVGVTLHALLVGQTPFHRGDLIQQILKNPPPSVERHQAELQIRNPVPKEVQQIILALLHKEREKRPATAAALRALLETERSPLPTRRRAIALLASGAAASAGLAAFGPLRACHRQPANEANAFRESAPPPARPARSTATPSADREILSFALQPDGGMLVGGVFTRFGGRPYPGLARLGPDATIDPGFQTDLSGIVRSILVLPDHRLLVGGDLWDPAGDRRIHLALLHPEGRMLRVIECDSTVLCMAQEAAGSLLVGGVFQRFDNQPRGRLVRLNANLETDPDFTPSMDGNIHTILPTDEGDLLLGGRFTRVNGLPVPYLARIDSAGRRVQSFGPALDQEVSTMALAPDGAVLIGGKFTRVGDEDCSGLIRVLPDGRLDAAFSPGLSGNIFSLALRRDGSVIAGGEFNHPAEGTQEPAKRHRDRIASIAADGGLDETFRHAASAPVKALAFGFWNDLLVGGGFSHVSGRECHCLHRVAADLASDRLEIDVTRGRLVWHRALPAQHLRLVTFELSRDGGKTWHTLGKARPCPEGWETDAPKPPRQALLRVRARTTSGIHNGSCGLLQFPFA